MTNELLRESNVTIEQFSYEVEDRPSLVTVIRAGHTPGGVHFMTDPLFHEKGIVTEGGSDLINQGETAGRFGKPAGETPETFLSQTDLSDVIAVPGTQYGWQNKTFMIVEGQPLLMKSDEEHLSGTFPTLCEDYEGKWGIRHITFQDGYTNNSLDTIRFGMDGVHIVRDGKVTTTHQLIEELSPRIGADLRAIWQASNNNEVPGSFFQLIRPLFAAQERDGERHKAFLKTALGETAVLSAVITSEDSDARDSYTTLKQLISDNPNLSHLEASLTGDLFKLTVKEGGLPEQRVPLIGWGCDADGGLIVVAVDGRTEASAGVSIAQLAELMAQLGAKDAVLGCGGGDVAVLEKDLAGNVRILNGPSNPEGTTRRVPTLIAIPR